MSSLYVTLFGGSFRTAQHTDMREKRGEGALVFLDFNTSQFFFRRAAFRTAQRTGRKEGTCGFLPFFQCARPHTIKAKYDS